MDQVVIVGASLAGLRAAETLRVEGYRGNVVIVGEEHHLPYDRPPLSKKVLAGEWEPERVQLRKPEEYDELGALRLGRRATGLDLDGRAVHLDDGEVLPFDGLVIATGAAPRRLPGAPDLDGIVTLRTLEDSLSLRDRLHPGARVVVVGAGFIGLEVAATACQRGAEVTVVEALSAPLVRGLGADLGHRVAAVHRRHGVDIRLGVGVDGFDGSDRVDAVRLADGTRLAAEVVVVGIGVVPSTAWLVGSGLDLRDGVVCDSTLSARPPGVYAAGDVARWPNRLVGGGDVRVEHWTNAAEQGAAAARNLLASAAGASGTPYEAVPFFWSDQFEARIQCLGRVGPDDDAEVVAGDPDDGRFVAFYRGDDRLTAVLGVSMPKHVMGCRKLLLAGASWDEALAHAAAW